MKNKLLANFALFLTALIWGVSFVAQREGMDPYRAVYFQYGKKFSRCIEPFAGNSLG